MLPYVASRLALAIPVFAGISLVTFFLVRLSGDPTDIMLPADASEAARREFRAAHRLDRPLWEQFAEFVVRALQGDFGRSLRFGQPASELVMERLGATTELALAAMVLSLLVGIPAGVVAAQRHDRPADHAIRTLALVGQAIPSFFLGIVGIIVFSVGLGWLPTGGRGGWEHLVLPAVALGAYLVALIARVTRSCMLDVTRQDYIRTARAKGLPESRVIWEHALRNALIPVVTVVGLQFGFLMGGVVVVETVFSWPGVGRLAVQAIYTRDFPIVQAVVFLFAVIFVVINLAVDLLYAVLDPRISLR